MGICSHKSQTLIQKDEVCFEDRTIEYCSVIRYQQSQQCQSCICKQFHTHPKQVRWKRNQKPINIQQNYPELNGIQCKNSFGVESYKLYPDSRKDCSEWAIIKKAILCDDESLVLQILGEANLKVIGNSIQVLVQDKHIFQVPIFVINEPTFCSNNKFELNFETSMLKVRVRSSKLPQDFEISTQSTSTIQEIKQIILSAAKETTCRLYLNGRELIDQNQLGNYSISSGTVYFNNYTIRQSKLFVIISIFIYIFDALRVISSNKIIINQIGFQKGINK